MMPPVLLPSTQQHERTLNGGLSMEIYGMFLDCPEYMNKQRTMRCGLPAEVEYRYAVESTGGPLESAKIRCPRGHWFNGPIEFLIWDKHPGAGVDHRKGAHDYGVASVPTRTRHVN
jgi:hypothetical protein